MGIIDLINALKNENFETDEKTLSNLKQIKQAIDLKKRKLWPSKEIRSVYNQLDKLQKKYFYDILCDMIEELEKYLENK